MHVTLINRRLKAVILAGVCLVGLSRSGQAAVYNFSDGSSGSPIGTISPGGAFPLSSVQNLSSAGMLTSISSLELTLTFNDSGALASDGSGIQGLLTLGIGGGSPYVAFNPVATSTSGGNSIYDVTFAAAPTSGFNGLNPNDTWSLLVWDNDSSIGNELVSWNLGITAVPEPANAALALFAALSACGLVVRKCFGMGKLEAR